MSEEIKRVEIEDMEEGTDAKELYADQGTHTEYITHKGKKWGFEVRNEITHEEKQAIISNATSMTTSARGRKAKFNLAMYNRMMLKKMLVKAPFSINDISLIKVSDEFGEKLERLIPKVEEIINEEDADFTEPSSEGT